MKKLYAFIFALGASSLAFAGGSQVNLQGQKQQGMGHVATAFTQGAENLFFNPGSISFLSEKTMISFGVNGIASGVVFQPNNEAQQYRNKPGLSTPFNIYATHKISDKLAAGIGLYIPFGSTVEWEDEWKGRYILQKVVLRSFYLQPTLSYKISDKVGIGVGGIIGLGSVVLEKDIPVADESGDRAYASLEGRDVSYGFNVGLYYEISEKLSLGFDYRSQMTFDVEGGDANFYTPNALSDRFPSNNKFDASLPLPSTTSFGFAYHYSDDLSFGVDMNIVGWAVYENLAIDFKKNTETLEDTDDTKDYSNTFIIRAGAEYKVNDRYTQRLGIYYDKTPVSDRYFGPETPDMDKLGICTGFSYKVGVRGSLDFSYILLTGAERSVENVETGFEGRVKAIGHIPGIGFSYNF